MLSLKKTLEKMVHGCVGSSLERVLVTGHARWSATITIPFSVLASELPHLQKDAVGWVPPCPGSKSAQSFSNLPNPRYIAFQNQKDIVASIPQKTALLVHVLHQFEHQVCGVMDEGSKTALGKDGF